MIVLDIETISDNPNDIVIKPEDQRMTYTGVIQYESGEEIDIWENDLEKLRKILYETDLIIGYNIIWFDIPVLAKYLGQELNQLPMLDLMAAAKEAIGYRPKLNNLANAMLDRGKLGSGSDAGKYYLGGQLDELKKYCLEDVRLTRDVYDYGKKYGKIKYFDKNGFIREAKIDWSWGYRNYGVQSSDTSTPVPQADDTLSLF
jgi:DEAD/DEAH box helicase domain-containing protein